MDFALPEKAETVRNAVLQFTARELRDDVVARDASASFWREGWAKCGDFGIQGLPVPTAYGGSGLDIVTTIAAMEALGYGCPDQGLIFSINAHLWTAAMPVAHFASEEQKQRLLPKMCRGELIGAGATTEPGAGSDSSSLTTRAERVGDHYVLNGSKTFITNAPVADVFVAYAATSPTAGQLGISAFIVERATPGLTVGRPIDKLGLRTSPMGEVWFEDCRVPAENLMGREGSGAALFSMAMEYERGCILAMYLGSMQRQLEQCIEYARTRHQFGHPIGRFQSVANRLVDMKVRLEAARLLLYKTGWLKDRDQSTLMDAAIAKLFVSEAVIASSLDAIQVFGGYGYTTEYQIERGLRDGVASRLFSGTNEIQRNIVARFLGLPPSTVRPSEPSASTSANPESPARALDRTVP